jgi:hypothetical protein
MLIPITAIVIFSSLIARWSVIAAFQRMLLQFAACFGRLQDAALGSAGTGFDPREGALVDNTGAKRPSDLVATSATLEM